MCVVHFVSAAYGNSRRYRCVHAREQLWWHGVPSAFSPLTEGRRPEAVAGARVIVLHRVPYDRYVHRLLLAARDRGAICLYDADDLIFDPTVHPPLPDLVKRNPRLAAERAEGARLCHQALAACDGALVTTGYLAEHVRKAGRPAWVHRNAFSLQMLRRAEVAYSVAAHGPGRVVVGYVSGSPTHDRDFALIRPILCRLLRAYPHVELRILGPVGWDGSWGSVADRVVRMPFVRWETVFEMLAQFDINLAPLELDHPFCQSKSEIKYVEAALVRVPTVASATDVYRHAIRPGENGLLAEVENEWERSLARLIEDAALRQELGRQAYADVLMRYHPAIRGRELMASLNAAIGQEVDQGLFPEPFKSGPPAGPAPDDDLDSPSLPRRLWHAARYRGARTLGRQAITYVEDLCSRRWEVLIHLI